MDDDLNNAKLSEQEVAAFAVTLNKVVRLIGGYSLALITAVSSFVGFVYYNPPGEQAVLNTISQQREAIESVVRPGKWTRDDDAETMRVIRAEIKRENEIMWREISANTRKHRAERSREHSTIKSNERRIDKLEECCD